MSFVLPPHIIIWMWNSPIHFNSGRSQPPYAMLYPVMLIQLMLIIHLLSGFHAWNSINLQLFMLYVNYLQMCFKIFYFFNYYTPFIRFQVRYVECNCVVEHTSPQQFTKKRKRKENFLFYYREQFVYRSSESIFFKCCTTISLTLLVRQMVASHLW